MTSPVVAVGPDATYKEIVTALRTRHVTAVPVVEGEGRVVGVVSEADLLPKEELRDTDPSLVDQRLRLTDYAKAGAVTAAELMSSPAVTVTAGATLPHAARLMAGRGVKRLPVVDGDGVLCGIVSRADLLKGFLRPDRDIAAEVRRDVVERLFVVSHRGIGVHVDRGTVTLTGAVRDAALIPVAERRTRAVEGVVDVRCELTAPPGARTPPGRRTAP
ncbi:MULTISPECIES: CBS domain-containing protein [unclassified Streptomyces]